MPFVFVSSALSSAAGLGLPAAPLSEVGPVKPLVALAGLAEVALSTTMEKQMGMVGAARTAPRVEREFRPAVTRL